jgi:UrcA family protein
MKRNAIECVGGLIVALAALGSGVAAATETPSDVPRVVVAYGDLNLSRTEGVHVLYSRLKGAAERVCDSLDRKDVERQLKFNHCRQAALDNAVSVVSLPALTSYHLAQVSNTGKFERVATR